MLGAAGCAAPSSDYNPTQRTHVLESAGSDPMGPYTYKNQLNSAWMLDPSVATINGSLYLFGSASGGTQNLVAARRAPGGPGR
ncbi:hypothetical protein OG931_46235 [Streptomyces phaeochromogenes]|nr:hypothetical protein [Streptomyces phaeochromogenes]WRZ34617.1 hypothetical protein OG931_46235 [Streptomyces phaeochromogenes]